MDESKLLEPASAEAEETDVIETKTTKIIENPTLEEIARYEAGNEVRSSDTSCDQACHKTLWP